MAHRLPHADWVRQWSRRESVPVYEDRPGSYTGPQHLGVALRQLEPQDVIVLRHGRDGLAGQHDAADGIADVVRFDIAQAADEQHGAHEQDDRQCGLYDDERVPEARATSEVIPPAGFERAREIGRYRLERGDQTGDGSRRGCEGKSENERSHIERRTSEVRLWHEQPPEQRARPDRCDDGGNDGDERE